MVAVSPLLELRVAVVVGVATVTRRGDADREDDGIRIIKKNTFFTKLAKLSSISRSIGRSHS